MQISLFPIKVQRKQTLRQLKSVLRKWVSPSHIYNVLYIYVRSHILLCMNRGCTHRDAWIYPTIRPISYEWNGDFFVDLKFLDPNELIELELNENHLVLVQQISLP